MFKIIYKRILQDNKKTIILIVFLITGSALLNNAPIKLIEGIVNEAVASSNHIKRILWFGVVYLVAQVVRAGLYASMGYHSELLQQKIGARIQELLFDELLKARTLDLKMLTTSELNNVLIEDVDFVTKNSILPMVQIVFSILSFVTAFYFMLTINILMPMIIIPLGVITSILVKRIEKTSKENSEQLKVNSIVLWKYFEEGIRGLFTLRNYGVSREYREMLSLGIEKKNKHILVQSKLKAKSYFRLSSLFMMTIGVILIIASVFVINNRMSIGGLTAILMYNHILVDPLVNFHELYFIVIRLKTSLKRIESVLQMKKIEDKENYFDFDSVTLTKGGFAYNDRFIFRNVDLNINRRTKLMLVGKSGSGKSTLVNVIVGNYPLNEGKIEFFSGFKIMERGKPKIITMLQEEYIFDWTIEENILLFDKNPDIVRLEKIIDVTELRDVISKKGKINVGENGANLSMGEQKRVLIARALYKNDASMYVFDELSGSLDRDTAHKIFSNVIKILDDKICIFIEHNLEMGRYMDKIFVIEEIFDEHIN